MLDNNMIDSFSNMNTILASPSRIKILTYLLNSPQSVEALSKLTELSMANVSKHLQSLLKNGVVKNTRDRNYIIYEIADDDTRLWLDNHFIVNYMFYMKRQTMIEAFSEENTLEKYTLNDLDKLLDNDDIILIDVRPFDEFEYAHIQGAISMPLETLETKMKHLSKDKTVIAYCRGPHCLLSLEAVEQLQKQGIKAIRMEESVLEWTIIERMRNYETWNNIRN